MRNYLFPAMIALAAFAGACKQKEIKTEHGHRFINHTNKSGEKAQLGQTVVLSVDTWVGDSLMASVRRDYGSPQKLKLPTKEQLTTNANNKVPAWLDATLLMTEGDSATVFQDLDSLMVRSLPDGLKDAKVARFEIVLVDIKTDDELKADQEAAAKAAEATKAQGVEIQTTLNQMLADYKAGKLGDRLQKAESGLEYVVLQPGTGELKEGESVPTHYYGILKATGKMFDNSYDRGQAIPFQVGRLVPGFNEGMKLIGRNGKGVLFIPAALAYGPEGNGPVPPNSDLVFYVDFSAPAPEN